MMIDPLSPGSISSLPPISGLTPSSQVPPTYSPRESFFPPPRELLPLPDADEVEAARLITPMAKQLKKLIDTLAAIEALHVTRIQSKNSVWQERHTKQVTRECELQEKILSSEENCKEWHFYHTIAASLLTAASVVVGGILCSQTDNGLSLFAGGSMIVGGISTIVGTALYDSGQYKEGAAILILLGSALSLVGSVAAPGLTQIEPSLQIAGKILINALSIGASATGVANHSTQMGHEALKADFALLEKEFAISSEDRKMLSTETTNLIHGLEDLVEDLVQSVTLYQHTITKITALSGPLGGV